MQQPARVDPGHVGELGFEEDGVGPELARPLEDLGAAVNLGRGIAIAAEHARDGVLRDGRDQDDGRRAGVRHRTCCKPATSAPRGRPPQRGLREIRDRFLWSYGAAPRRIPGKHSTILRRQAGWAASTRGSRLSLRRTKVWRESNGRSAAASFRRRDRGRPRPPARREPGRRPGIGSATRGSHCRRRPTTNRERHRSPLAPPCARTLRGTAAMW